MIASLSKNVNCLIWKHTSPLVCRFPPASFSLSLQFFSTSSERKLCISPTLLVRKYEFSPELASRVASELSHLKNSKNADSILNFFKQSGFSNTQLVKIVNYRPRFLAASLEVSIKPKIKILQEVGFSSDDIIKIISNNPRILHLSVKNNIIPSLSVLKGLLGSDSEVATVLSLSPWVLKANLKDILVPNVEFLKSFGIPMKRIRTVLTAYPGCFVVKPEIVRKSAEKAKEMGLNASSKKFIYAIVTIAKMRNEGWEFKLQAFRNMGFSDCDIVTMFGKDPRVFSVSVEKIKKVKELLLATGKFDISSIVNNPLSLGFSVEKRYKPRLRILGILESRNLIEEWPSLGTIYNLPDDKFFNKFISPYSNEIRDVCTTKSSARGRKEKKPALSTRMKY